MHVVKCTGPAVKHTGASLTVAAASRTYLRNRDVSTFRPAGSVRRKEAEHRKANGQQQTSGGQNLIWRPCVCANPLDLTRAVSKVLTK